VGTATLGVLRKENINRMIRLKVKEVAGAKNISQRKLSKLSEVDIKTLQKIFRDPYRVVTTETLDKLARALGVDARELIESVTDNAE
jgi:DNA-binding Xre family transcriptional regulator